MSKNASPNTGRLPRLLSVLVVIIGAVIFVMGVAIYGFTSNMISKENITVLTYSDDNPGPLAGKPVRGPFTAMATAAAINHHVLVMTGGRTYGQIPQIFTNDGQTYSRDVAATAASDGQAHAAGTKLTADDAKTYQLRKSAEEGAFLQASLLVSVLAFGVAALIAGLGLVIAFIGFTLIVILRGRSAAPAAPAAA